jgi:hypothetical protein
MYYYEVQVIIPNESDYSFAIPSEIELTDKEVINIAKRENKFETDWDDEYVDSIDLISEKDFNEWYSN